VSTGLSWRRVMAVARKEMIQLRRDHLTFAMMAAVPLVQLLLFGYAINADPKHLPAAVVEADASPMSRSIIAALQHSDYYDIRLRTSDSQMADRALEGGEVSFVLTIPVGFDRQLVRGERPALLLEADASDPSATGNAIGALPGILDQALARDLIGPLGSLAAKSPPYDLRIHRRYNPEIITAYNIVPGLMGVILTMTMIMMTALAVTREVERGTMENLLATPLRPLEVMVGKIAPYVAIAYVQVAVILLASVLLFSVPIEGSVLLLLGCVLLFVIANLTVGITFSSLARNQTQAMQMTFFFFLPSILLSGFMFPYAGMPTWARWLGETLPLTHFLRITRGILLKGWGLGDVWPHLLPILVFTAAVLVLALGRFRRTLD